MVRMKTICNEKQSQALNGQTCEAKTHERKHVRHVQAENGPHMHVAMSTLQVLHVMQTEWDQQTKRRRGRGLQLDGIRPLVATNSQQQI